MLLGIIGKPNAGKSTFFKSITLNEVEIAPYPFTTINPNLGIAYVISECPCKDLKVQCNPRNSKCVKGRRYIPVNVMDVAGLIPGAHEGKGLGNKFLDDLRSADALIQVIDVSGRTNEKGEVTDYFDPSEEISIIEKEINLWFYEVLKRNWESIIGKIRTGNINPSHPLAEKLAGIGIKKNDIEIVIKEIGKDLKELSKEDLIRFAFRLREISKPIIYACNKIDIEGSQEKFKKIQERFGDKILIPVSAEAELTLKYASEKNFIDYNPIDSFEIIKEVSEKQRKALEFIKKEIIEKFGSTGVQKVLNTAVFDMLNYIVVYPVENENSFSDKQGNVLPDAILLKKGSTALDLAFKIHTEIGAKFIKAVDARTKKIIGKDYELKNNDIIKIVF
jgi:ribosome-binding ATPase YchF (GTP1/OBG family)